MTPAEEPGPRFCVHIFWTLTDGVGSMQLKADSLGEAKAFLAEAMTKTMGTPIGPEAFRAIMVKHGPIHLWEITCGSSTAMWAKAHRAEISCPPAWTRRSSN